MLPVLTPYYSRNRKKQMSRESFLSEFYPLPATSATKTWIEAIKHAVRKWKGLLPDNVKKHNQKVPYDSPLYVFDENGRITLVYSAKTRSLCIKNDEILFGSPSRNREPCKECPLWKLTGVNCMQKDTPYNKTLRGGNPQVLIDALYATQWFILATESPKYPISFFSSPIIEFTDMDEKS